MADFTHSLELSWNRLFFSPIFMGKGKDATCDSSKSGPEPFMMGTLSLAPSSSTSCVPALAPAQRDKQRLSEKLLTQPD